MRDKIIDIIDNAFALGLQHQHYGIDKVANEILALLAPELEKARKWDEVQGIIDSAHLYALAEWIDLKYPNDSNPEVQTDLRRLADTIANKEDGDVSVDR